MKKPKLTMKFGKEGELGPVFRPGCPETVPRPYYTVEMPLNKKNEKR